MPKLVKMDDQEVIRRCEAILAEANVSKTHVLRTNFLDYADTVKDVVANWHGNRIRSHGVFLENLKRMRDDFDEVVRKDPACIYVPANKMARAFERSIAKLRYVHGGNRISKTETCAIDNYRVVTRQHPFRPLPPEGGSVFIIGTDFKNYAPAVFETKYVYGEAGNPLSPLFPEDGKWFYHYDDKKHILTVGCPDCAKKYQAQQCPGHHIKPVIRLFSDYEKPTSVAGAQYAQFQFDEQIQYHFWAESLKRLETVPNSGGVVSETPIYGRAWWTYEKLKLLSQQLDAAGENIVPGTNRPLIEVFSCNQYEGGLMPHHEIEASKKLMTEPEIRARIYGEHVAASENAVFDLTTINNMRDECRSPMRGQLFLEAETPLGSVLEDSSSNEKNATAILGLMKEKDRAWVKFREDEKGKLRIFTPSNIYEQYFITADVAKGLTKGDFSCADVWCVRADGFTLTLEQVAQYHGWINSSEYGCELMKLATWYNSALLVIERTGPGDATINKLRELGYWNLYVDLNQPSAARLAFGHLYGVDTNVATKPVMIALLQSVIKDRATGQRSIVIRAKETLEEAENYVQEPSESGRSMTFHGAGTMHDDRVMSAAIAAYVLKTNPGAVYDFSRAQKMQASKQVDSGDWITQKFWKGLHAQQERARVARQGRR